MCKENCGCEIKTFEDSLFVCKHVLNNTATKIMKAMMEDGSVSDTIKVCPICEKKVLKIEKEFQKGKISDDEVSKRQADLLRVMHKSCFKKMYPTHS